MIGLFFQILKFQYFLNSHFQIKTSNFVSLIKVIHKFCGVLSAYGIGLADVVVENQSVLRAKYKSFNEQELQKIFQNLADENLNSDQITSKDSSESGEKIQILHEKYLEMKYFGSDYSLMIQGSNFEDFKHKFQEAYIKEFGFVSEERDIFIEAARVRTIYQTG